MQLTVQYSASLPPGFKSGSITLTSRTTYIDKDARINQPVYRAIINADRGLSNVQAPAQQLQIVGMGQGDPVGAGVLDVVVSMVVTGLTAPLKYTFQVIPLDTGGGNLNLHAPNIHVPVVGPLPATLQALIDQAAASNAQIYTATQTLTSAMGGLYALQTSVNTAITNANSAVSSANDAVGLVALASSIAAQSADAANLAAQVARDAAATLPAPPVADANARAMFFAMKSGDCSCVQMDTLHVWQRLNGIITDLGVNSKALGSGGVKPVGITSGLAAMQGMTQRDLFNVGGAVQEGDGGGGLWQWVVGDRPPENIAFIKHHASDTSGFFARLWDGMRANMGWTGTAAAAGTAAVVAGLIALSGLAVTLDKKYTNLTGEVGVPDFTRIDGPVTTGFEGTGQNTLLRMGEGAEVAFITVDGMATPQRFTGFTTDALIMPKSGATVPAQIISVTAKNAGSHVVYGNLCNGTVVDQLKVDGCNGDAIYFQRSSDLRLIHPVGKGLQAGLVKVHSKDGPNQTWEIANILVEDPVGDYRGMNLSGEVLFGEFWGGQTAFVRNARCVRPVLYAPDSITGGGFFGVSADTCRDGGVDDVYLDGGVNSTLGIGVELAGCINFAYDGGTVKRYQYIGCSLSQPNTQNCAVGSR